jgi:hypothetical protein
MINTRSSITTSDVAPIPTEKFEMNTQLPPELKNPNVTNMSRKTHPEQGRRTGKQRQTDYLHPPRQTP